MHTSRDFQKPGASTAIGENGMVATSHPAATLAAVEILRRGGNAVDAAIAAVAVQSVVDPLMTGIGGDCFALYSAGGATPIAINGSGRAPARAHLSYFAEQGIEDIGDTCVHSVTVPGAIDAWCRLSMDHGTMALSDVFESAIAAAESGYLVTPRVAYDWAKFAGRLRHDAAAMRQFLPQGRAPAAGERMANPALGATLRAIGEGGPSAFYEGPVADDMVAVLKNLGGLHESSDFASHLSSYTVPIEANYRGFTVHECPPNGQGLAALIILRILEGYDLPGGTLSEADRIHLLAEATKAAYFQRDAIIADPEVSPLDVADVLSDRTIAQLRGRIRIDRAAPPQIFGEVEHKDTIYLTVVDKDRNAISLINSIFWAFGSGIYAERSGVLLQNRGAGFRLIEGHPNAIAPGKRPMHTIIPGMMSKDGRVVLSFGVMGGQYQATGHAHFISQIVDRGKGLQEASDLPRSFSFGNLLTLERTHRAGIAEDLAARGHAVDVSAEPLGGCQAIWIDPDKDLLYGASDHRKDGFALGF